MRSQYYTKRKEKILHVFLLIDFVFVLASYCQYKINCLALIHVHCPYKNIFFVINIYYNTYTIILSHVFSQFEYELELFVLSNFCVTVGFVLLQYGFCFNVVDFFSFFINTMDSVETISLILYRKLLFIFPNFSNLILLLYPYWLITEYALHSLKTNSNTLYKFTPHTLPRYKLNETSYKSRKCCNIFHILLIIQNYLFLAKNIPTILHSMIS